MVKQSTFSIFFHAGCRNDVFLLLQIVDLLPGVPVKQWPELYRRIPRAELNVRHRKQRKWKTAEGGSDAKCQFLGPELRTQRALKYETRNDQIPNM